MTDPVAIAPADASVPGEVAADFFDGRSARAHRVRLRVDAGHLLILSDDVNRGVDERVHELVHERVHEPIHQHVPLTLLQWPESTRHGVRILRLPDGASLQGRDNAAWDAWSAAFAGRRDSIVVHAQQGWKWVMLVTLLLVGLILVSYRHVVPWAARALVAVVPLSVDESLGEAALASIDDHGWTLPSALPAAKQQALRDAFAQAVAHLPGRDVPSYRLEFRRSTIGPNAFALPGGPIVLTDGLYTRVDGDRDLLIGVLGHELGHLRHRHGMRMLAQAGMLSVAAGALYGDFSTLFSQIPVLLGQASYSRDAEHEADVDAVRLLRANGISPAVMARFFVKVRQVKAGDKGDVGPQTPIALASHPADDERIRFFERAAEER